MFCEVVAKERVNYTLVLVPTMINFLMQFAGSNPHDLTSLELLAYGGSPMAPQLIRKTRELLPNTKLVQAFGLSETGFLTGLQDREYGGRPTSLCLVDGPAQASTCRLWTTQATRSKPPEPR